MATQAAVQRKLEHNGPEQMNPLDPTQRVVPQPLQRSLFYLLEIANERIAEKVAESLSKIGISPRHYAVLSVIASSDPTNQVDIGAQVGVNRNMMVQVIDQLEQLSLALRKTNPGNRREHIIEITDKGKKTLERVAKSLEEVHAACTSKLTVPERKTLVDLLNRVVC